MSTSAESQPSPFARTELDATQTPEIKTETGGFEAPKRPAETADKKTPLSVKQEALHARVHALQIEDEESAMHEIARLQRLILGDKETIRSRNVTAVTQEDIDIGLTARRIDRSKAAGTIYEEAPTQEPAQQKTFFGGVSTADSFVIPQGLSKQPGRISTERGSVRGISLNALERSENAHPQNKLDLSSLTDEEIEASVTTIQPEKPRAHRQIQSRTQRALGTSLKPPSRIDADRFRHAP